MPLLTAALDRHTVVSPDGTHLSVLLATPPDGVPRADGVPPVLAVHGFASSAARGWQRTGHLDALTRAGRTVIAPDLRGHGSSDRPHHTEAYTLPGMLADLIAAVTGSSAAVTQSSPMGARPQPIDLLGYSLGARLGWALACEARLPVRRMVLGGFDGRPLFQGVDTDRLDRLAASAPDNDREALRHLVAGLAGTGGSPPAGALPAIPTLLAAGEKDPLATRARHLAAQLADGSFLPVPGRGHVSTVPASVFRRAVVEFLAVTDRTGAAGAAQAAAGR